MQNPIETPYTVMRRLLEARGVSGDIQASDAAISAGTALKALANALKGKVRSEVAPLFDDLIKGGTVSQKDVEITFKVLQGLRKLVGG